MKNDFNVEKERIINHFNNIASKRDIYKKRARYFHQEIIKFLKFNVPENSSVIEFGCRTCNYLNHLNPKYGVGVDFSPKMIEIASKKYPRFEFLVDDLDLLRGDYEKFDYIIVTDEIGHATDLQKSFMNLKKLCKKETRIIILYFNYLWSPLIRFAEIIGWRMPQPKQHWLPLQDFENLLEINDFQVIRKGYRVLFPFYIPLISSFLNRFVANLPIFWKICLAQVVIARPIFDKYHATESTCSVIVPAKNEKENIENAVHRIPQMGKQTEIILVEGGSHDGTYEECIRVKEKYSNNISPISVYKQTGKGKGDAVRLGFSKAFGDILMILDADLTVAPEDLPKFFDAIIRNKGEFINGSRLVYPMENEAMRFLNLLGNKFFSWAFTYILEQRLRDTLCGTKVLWKNDYIKIDTSRRYFGNFDPFGDFDLLFGAAKLNYKIIEIPIKYRKRYHGETQIKRFPHGWLLLKMTLFALKKIKFI